MRYIFVFVTCMMKNVKQGLIFGACVIREVKAKVCAFTRVVLHGKAQAENKHQHNPYSNEKRAALSSQHEMKRNAKLHES